jgi:serine protease Do
MSVVKTLQKQKLLSFSLLLFTLSIGILIGTLMTRGVSAQKGQAAPDATPLTIPSPVQLSNEFSRLAKRLEPSVVNITADYLARQSPPAGNRRRQQQQAPQNPEDELDLFQRFFGPFGEVPQGQQRRAGTGSGVIVDSNGYILTNNHVVEGADRIQVQLTGDPSRYEAKLIGTDFETDLAVIKIDAPKKLAAVKIGNSDAVQVGDWAVAIGSPFGLDATVTAGIISAKERSISENPEFQHFLQTDAAINPGNSGGPLLNINGELIGINTAIATTSSSPGYQGVGFALPSNTAVSVYNQIIKNGKVTRGSIGVSLQDAERAPDLLKVYGAGQGAFVRSVERGSPAAKAGLQEGDIILSYNGKPVARNDDLISSVSEAPVGSKATVGVLRDGKKTDFEVTVGNRAEVWANERRYASRRPAEATPAQVSEAKFGISVMELDETFIEGYGYPEKSGVRVESVEPASFADDVGLRPGDVITALNRKPVGSHDDLLRLQRTLKPGDSVVLRILRPRVAAGGSQLRGGSRPATWDSFYPSGTLPAK